MAKYEKLECKKKLQEVITEKLKKEAEAQTIPENLNANISSLNAAKAELARLTEAFEAASSEEKSLFIQYSDANQKSNDYQAQIESLNTQREYEAMQKQISDAEAMAKSLLVARNAKSEEVKALQAEIENQEAICGSIQQSVDEEQSTVDEKLSEVKKAIEALDDQINEIRGTVLSAEDFDKLYTIAKKKGGKGLVPIRGQVCMGCNTVLPIQFVIDLRIAQEKDENGTCPYCSREIFFEKAEDEKNYIFETSESTKSSAASDNKDPYETEDSSAEDESNEYIGDSDMVDSDGFDF